MNDIQKIEELFDDGRHALVSGDFGRSVEAFSQVLASKSDHRLALISRGSAYIRLERFSDAIKDFDRSIELDPSYARAYHLRGVAKEQIGEHESAIEDFSRAIGIDPEYGAAYYSRATLLTKLKKEDQAVDDIQMVQHLTNKNIETFANDNNVWRSQQLRAEAILESDLERS